jgi:von Willebrand factor type A domain
MSVNRARLAGAGFLLLAPAGPLAAETCWSYVENRALAPIVCVQKSDLTTPCSYGSVSAPNDCTTVPAPANSQSILEMHRIWHQCFGAVGGAVPPGGRGQRWYAFHRQFEFDYDIWRRGIGFDPIESLDWCPGMDMPYGIFPSGQPVASPGQPPNVCSTKPDRPDHMPCPECTAMAQCLFLPGAGPIGCPGSPSPTCRTPDGTVSFPFTSLDQFGSVDDVAKILDGQFHGLMHGAVADADNVGFYNDDNLGSRCSPRDGMFWRLHKALDDVVRAWQDVKAVDVVVVVDRSGSMADPDGSGTSKLQAALTAVDNFADLLEEGRPDGAVNRMGLVSYSDGVSTDMPMTNVDATLRSGPLATGIAAINAAGAVGCTGMGGGIERALQLLCPPSGNCSGFSGAGNARKAILLLTDGVENVPHCIQPSGASGPTCGGQCFGAQIDYAKLHFTQLVAVGFGTAASLDGPKLALLAERQGGIYVQNPGATSDDLKHFFTKAFGELTDEFTRVDPTGLLPAAAAATAPVPYDSCTDAKLTFASGWQQPLAPAALRLLVTAPGGALVRRDGPGVEASRESRWDFARVHLPLGAPASGHWSAQLVRPHRVYVNGFTPDAFAAPAQGVALVRNEIHRLCPDGCRRVLHFEYGLKAASAYTRAVSEEKAAGLLGTVKATADPGKFRQALDANRWDLVVYGYMGPDQAQPYDQRLAGLLCEGQRAILTDVRADKGGPAILRCGGALRDGSTDWAEIVGDGSLHVGSIKLRDPGRPVWSYGLKPTSAQSVVQATTPGGKNDAVTAIVTPGQDVRWYLDVLGAGLARIDLHNRALDQRAGDTLYATAHILPSFIPAGGFDAVDARVEVTYPKVGLGTLLARAKGDPRVVNRERLDARLSAAAALTVPTGTAVFPLYDDGTRGDEVAGNAYWTGPLSGIGATDGTYTLHFIFDLTKNGCTTRRELTASTYVSVRPDPPHSHLQVVTQTATPAGGLRTVLRLTPADALGNLWGPGHFDATGCDPAAACRIDTQSLVDEGDGSYEVALDTPPHVRGVRLSAAGGSFDVALPCPTCPRLVALTLDVARLFEHGAARATLRLDQPAPPGGAVVLLSSGNPMAATVPASVTVGEGQTQATFEVTLHHAHDGPALSTLVARYGDSDARAPVRVLPLAWKAGLDRPVGTPTHAHDPEKY